jgi:hypothetical protein
MKFDKTSLAGGSLKGLVLPDTDNVHKDGKIAVHDKTLKLSKNASWINVTDLSGAFSFASHTFTSAGKTRDIGPTHAELLSAYSGVDWAQSANNFTSVGGIQKFRVPRNGVYRVEATGAGGTTANGTGYPSKTVCDVRLIADDVLSILCGQGVGGGSACGGTFVESAELGLIAVGAGGGGAPAGQSANAAIDITTVVGSFAGTNRGTPAFAGGGAGYSASGTPPTTTLTPAAKSFKDGGQGGSGTLSTYSASAGGFGGGGVSVFKSGSQGCGGGGGYSGGNAGLPGRGGTSFCLNTSRVSNRSCTQRTGAVAQGTVVLTYIGP